MAHTELDEFLIQAKQGLAQLQSLADLQTWQQQYFAKAGKLTALKKRIGQLEPAERKAYGQAVNQLSQQLEQLFYQRQQAIKLQELAEEIAKQKIDISLPAHKARLGGLHPLTQIMREVIDVFMHMGFSVYQGPHVELDENNFQLLNIPKHHPARDMQDTFFISEDVVMRTHTSPAQIHAMREFSPNPVQIITPGLCYRYEDITPRSDIQFHQIEGLLIGEQVSFSDLKGILTYFAQAIFGPEQAIKMRGSYFPFTEPSVEVDIKCTMCQGRGCRICKYSGWLEILGAGLVHPNVLRNGGYDPKQVRGIAFGLGIARILLLRHRIEDIRYFFQNDIRFLAQFN